MGGAPYKSGNGHSGMAYCTMHALALQFTRSATLPDVHLNVILRRSFTRPSTALAVIEGLGTRLAFNHK